MGSLCCGLNRKWGQEDGAFALICLPFARVGDGGSLASTMAAATVGW